MNVLLLEMKMKALKISNEDMANYLNIDASTFYRKKSGISDFSRKEMQMIKKRLNLSSEEVDHIFFGEELT